MVPQSLKELFRDIGAFGMVASLRAMGRKLGSGVLELNHPKFGTIAIRRGDSDYATIRQIFRDQEYALGNGIVESRILDRYRSILAQGQTPVVVDAGANIGAAAIWFSRTFPDASIVAIEPDSENARMLRRNCAGHSHATVVEAAIGAEPGHVSVVNTGLSWSVTTERSSSGCPVITVEQAVAMIPNGAHFIAKIDIEGFEKDLFTTNLDWINNMAAIFLEPHDWKYTGGGTSFAFQHAMGERRFELFLRGENLCYVNSAILT